VLSYHWVTVDGIKPCYRKMKKWQAGFVKRTKSIAAFLFKKKTFFLA